MMVAIQKFDRIWVIFAKMVQILTLPICPAEPIIDIKNDFLFILSLWIPGGDADYDDYIDLAPPPDPRVEEPFEQAESSYEEPVYIVVMYLGSSEDNCAYSNGSCAPWSGDGTKSG